MHTLAVFPCGRSGSYAVPDGVTGIEDFAFCLCRLTAVTLPNSVTAIAPCAFYGCSSLISADVPDSVTGIGYQAFSGCISLAEFTIPDGVTVIEDGVFANCTGLSAVAIPAGVTAIGSSAFQGCSSLTSIDIPASVTIIGDNAFDRCSSLTSIDIPAGVTVIGNSAFSGCSGLTDIDIPAGVTDIGDMVFYFCSGLYSVSIPNGVTGIGGYAFCGCSQLYDIDIPYSVGSIGDYAFAECSVMDSAVIRNPGCSIGNGSHTVFEGCSSSFVLSGWEDSTAETYAQETDTAFDGWARSGSCGAGAGWTFDIAAGALTISGTGDMEDYTVSQCPWGLFRSQIVSVVIGSGVTGIGNRAFARCPGLTGVSIPDSVTRIGNSAFSGCTGLIRMILPDSVTVIGDAAFGGCTGLAAITIPDGVTVIGYLTFSNCTGLTAVTIPAGVTAIGEYAFGDCVNLTDVYYAGTAAEWAAVTVGSGNEPLAGAAFHWESAGMIRIEASFPDPAFRGYVSGEFDADGDGWLSQDEIAAVTSIDMEGNGDVRSVQGIEYFTELHFLVITGYPGLTGLDLRANTGIQHAEVSNNGLTELYVDGLENLHVLNCSDNALTSLDVRSCGLTALYCHNNPMTVLQLGSQPGLNELWCYGVSLAELDITGCPELIRAYHGAKDTSGPDCDIYGSLLLVDKGRKIIAGDPEPTFFLPAGLTVIGSEAFAGIPARGVVIPGSVESIAADAFAGSQVTTVYGFADSAAQAFCAEHSGLTFIEIDDHWMESR